LIFPVVPAQSGGSNSFNLRSNSEEQLRIVVIGALSIGKGSWIAQEVSALGHSPHILTVYHIGRAANFRKNEENHSLWDLSMMTHTSGKCWQN